MGLLLDYLQAILNRGEDTREDHMAYRGMTPQFLLRPFPLRNVFPPNLPVRTALHNTFKPMCFCGPVSNLWIKVTISGLQYYSTLFVFFKFFFCK